MVSNTLRLSIYFLKINHILHPHYNLKIIGHCLKNKQKNKCVFIPEIIRLIITQMKMKMKNGSHRYDIYRVSSRHGHKYSKYKNRLGMISLYVLSNT